MWNALFGKYERLSNLTFNMVILTTGMLQQRPFFTLNFDELINMKISLILLHPALFSDRYVLVMHSRQLNTCTFSRLSAQFSRVLFHGSCEFSHIWCQGFFRWLRRCNKLTDCIVWLFSLYSCTYCIFSQGQFSDVLNKTVFNLSTGLAHF